MRSLPVFFVFFFISCSVLDKQKRKEDFFKAVWIKNNDPIHRTGNLPIALNSPLIYKGLLYAGHDDGVMNAYELESGRLVWSEGDDKGGFHGRPLGHEDHIIYGTVRGRVYARHYLSGAIKYSVDLDAPVESQGIVFNGRLFFHLRNHKLFCLDVKTGKILWAYKHSIPYGTTSQRVSSPFIYKKRLYAGFADGHIASFSLEEGRPLWETRISMGGKFNDVDTNLVFFKGKLLAGTLSGSLSILDPIKGKIIRRLPWQVYRKPLIRKKNLYLGTSDGTLIHLNHRFKPIKKKRISSSPINSLVFWKDKLIVSTMNGHIMAINPNDFSLDSSIQLGHTHSTVFDNMETGEGKLAFISSRHRLYVFR